MFFKKQVIDFGKVEENSKKEEPISVVKSAYIHDYSNWSTGEKKSDIEIKTKNGDNCLIELDFHKERYGRSAKPLYDYNFLIFDSASNLEDIQIKELKKATEINIPIIVLNGTCYQKRDYNGNPLGPKKYLFLDFLKDSYFKFEYNEISGKGRTANIKSSIFKIWWDLIQSYYLTFENLPEGASILAENNAKIPIAWNINNFILIPGHNRAYLDQEFGDYSKGLKLREEYFKELLNFILTFKPESKLPIWFSEYHILDEEDLINKREKINAQLNEIKEIKKIVTATGSELENVFSGILKLLKIKWKKIGTEDFLIVGKPNIVIEVTGIKNNLDGKKAIQSLEHKEVLRNKVQGEFKSCVIINHQIERNPKDRNNLDHHTIKEYFEKHDICIMSSLTLVNYFEKIIKKELGTDDFLQKIISTVGELR